MRNIFLSYHHKDAIEVQQFVDDFRPAFADIRALGVQTSDSFVPPEDQMIDSDTAAYVMRRIREEYIRGTSCTIVLVGGCTWARRYVDWEVAATLRDNATDPRGGLLAITLPSVAGLVGRRLPPRVELNVVRDHDNNDAGHARWEHYPSSADSAVAMVEAAIERRDRMTPAPGSTTGLRQRSAPCP